MEIPKIYKEENLDKFKLFDYNRDVNARHVEKLCQQFDLYFDLHLRPIVVTPEFFVIDGQHRLQAAKVLRKPVFYVIDTNYSMGKLKDANITCKKWEAIDYINFYASQGIQEYQDILTFMRNENCDCTDALTFLTNDSGDSRTALYEGRLEVQPIDIVTKKHKFYVKTCEIIKKYRPSIQNMLTVKIFKQASKWISNQPLIDEKEFLRCLEKNVSMMQLQGSTGNYIQNFMEIYNYNRKSKRIQLFKSGNKFILKEI